jgi:hypothetical protein
MTLRTILRSTPALLLVTTAAAIATAGPAMAEERTCRGTIGAVTLDNLRVP